MSEFAYRYTRARVGEKAAERFGMTPREEVRETVHEHHEDLRRMDYRYARPSERVKHTYRRGVA